MKQKTHRKLEAKKKDRLRMLEEKCAELESQIFILGKRIERCEMKQPNYPQPCYPFNPYSTEPWCESPIPGLPYRII